MPRINKLIKVAIHFLLWVLLYFLNYIFTRNYAIDFDFIAELGIIIVYAVIFYVNYYLLMSLLYKKKTLLYLLLSCFLITGALVIKDTIYKNRFERNHQERIERRPNYEHVSDLFRQPEPPRHKPAELKGRKFLFNVYGVLLFFALSFSMRFIKKWQDDERNKSELEKEKVKTELNFLKQQINPHFLFNSLNSIYSLSLSKSDVTTSSILKLSSILRYMLYESEDSLVSLNDEITTIKDYIDLQQLRLTDKVNLNLQVNGSPQGHKIVPFILLPLIENAFKYGVDNLYDSFIGIVFNIENDKLSMMVSNKIVSKKIKKDKNSGIGLKNILRRLELLYPDEYSFNIEKVENIFTVELELALRS